MMLLNATNRRFRGRDSFEMLLADVRTFTDRNGQKALTTRLNALLMAQHGTRTPHHRYVYPKSCNVREREENPTAAATVNDEKVKVRDSVSVASRSRKRNNKVFIKRKQMVKYLVGCQLVVSPRINVSLRIAHNGLK